MREGRAGRTGAPAAMALCAISGAAAEDPVVSVKSGHVFSARLVHKALAETGRCPATGEPLQAQDLLPLQPPAPAPPRPAAAASVPGLLGLFHDEWDAAMLEAHEVRRALHAARQELSRALYQHDAACRVIARLLRERDDARAALAAAQRAPALPQEGGGGGAPANPSGKRERVAAAEAGDEGEAKKKAKALPAAVTAELEATNKRLSKGRKKRPLPEGLAAPEALGGYGLLGTHPVHQTTKPGVAALDVYLPGAGDEAAAGPGAAQLVTGGKDTKVSVVSAAGKRLQSLAGHKKPVAAVAFVGSRDVVASGSGDATCKVWRKGGTGKYACVSTFADHAAGVTAVSAHPSGKYLVSASLDAAWGFYDLEAGECLARAAGAGGPGGFTCGGFHPDGTLWAGGGGDAKVRVFDVRSQQAAATLGSAEAPAEAIHALSFSENGYYLASSAASVVQLWDLRKLKSFRALEHDAGPLGVAFDPSGAYLGAVGGGVVRVYGAKQQWGELFRSDQLGKKGGLCVKFGPLASFVAVGGGDHNLRLFGPQ